MRVLQKIMVVAVVLLASSTAIAAETVLFQDNFDGATVGSLPGPAAVGTWVVATGSDPTFIEVVDADPPANLPEIPGQIQAVSSPNYFSIARSAWNAMLATFARQTNPDDLIRFEVDFYGTAGAQPYFDIYDGTNELNYVMALGNGNILAPGSGTTLTYNTGEWNHLVMDYRPAASTFDLSINGNAQTGIPMAMAATGFDSIGFSSVKYVSHYDNVSIVRNPGQGNETVLFGDNFDSGTPGSLPGPATAGTWVMGGGSVATDMQVVASPPPIDPPGPVEPVSSPNGLSIVRTNWNQMNATFQRQTNPTDRVRLEVDFYGAEGALPYLDIWDGTAELNWVLAVGDGSIAVPSAIGATTSSPATVTYNLDAWNHLVMDYSPGASTFNLRVNGVLQTNIPMYQSSTGFDSIGLSCVTNAENGRGAIYDNVKIILNPATLPGDANGDGVVNAEDAAALAANWLASGGWSQGDFNADGFVDDKDATILAANWQNTVGSASVPEPSAVLMMVVLGAFGIGAVMRRK